LTVEAVPDPTERLGGLLGPTECPQCNRDAGQAEVERTVLEIVDLRAEGVQAI